MTNDRFCMELAQCFVYVLLGAKTNSMKAGVYTKDL